VALPRQLLHTACDRHQHGEEVDQELSLREAATLIISFRLGRPLTCHVSLPIRLYRPGRTGVLDLLAEAQDGPEVDGKSIYVGTDTSRGLNRRRLPPRQDYSASRFGLGGSPDLLTGGKTDQGKLIHSSVFFHTYSHFTRECDFS
jgi:hypothetical protein